MSGYGMTVPSGTVAMVRGIEVPSGGGMVMMGIVGVTTLHPRDMGKSELPPLLEVMSPSSVDSLRIVCSDGNPLRPFPRTWHMSHFLRRKGSGDQNGRR
jgi:hypothetical protein